MRTTVYYATNRVVSGDGTDLAQYTADLQPPSVVTGLVYGTAFVDGVDLASGSYGAVSALQNVSVGGFSAEAVADLGQGGRNILVFVHGFDNSFSDALTRAAYNREWLAASGNPQADTSIVALSWPSLGQLFSFPVLQGDYLRDQNVARQSGVHTMTFLANLEPILTAARQAGRRTYLLAHSMGNLALESGVENWFLHGNGRGTLFDRVILAAGDCKATSFAQPEPAGLSQLSQLAANVSVYFSGLDHVLQLSQAVNLGAQRLGQDGPFNRSDPKLFPAPPYQMVDATGFTDYDFGFLTSHQYYRLSPTARAAIAASL